jgi:hypothetical protein
MASAVDGRERVKEGGSSGGVKALTDILRPGAGWRRVARGSEMMRRRSQDQPAWGRRGS